MKHDSEIVADELVFARLCEKRLSDILNCTKENYQGTKLRDTLSTFRFVEKTLGVNLAENAATLTRARELFAGMRGPDFEISHKTLQNHLSRLLTAIREFGSKRYWIGSAVQLDPIWADLLALVPERIKPWGLSRLAAYCTIKRIPPDMVRPETLLGLLRALEAEGGHKCPSNTIKHTIAIWNMCLREVSTWPPAKLMSPFSSKPHDLPLTAFPKSFQDDVSEWVRKLEADDPFDLSLPPGPYRPSTVESHVRTIRRLASELVHSQTLPIEHVRDLGVFFSDDNFKLALKPFLPGQKIKTKGYAQKMANHLLLIARWHLQLSEAKLSPFRRIKKNLAPSASVSMSPDNRRKLAQFDDPANVAKLMNFPGDEYARALKLSNLFRRAKCVERALLVSLLIHCGPRLRTLQGLRLDCFRKSDVRTFVTVTADNEKNARPMEIELHAETAKLYAIFVEDHRAHLPGADSQLLFPGERGGQRSPVAIRYAVKRSVTKHTGLDVHPHLFRHIIGKLVLERHPDHLGLVSRLLGHRTVNVAFGHYLGTETPTASRELNRILDALVEEPVL